MIDWSPIAEHAGFPDPETMFRTLYAKYQSTRALADYLGASHTIIGMKLRSLGIKMLPRGGANNTTGKTLQKLRVIDTHEYTADELALVCENTTAHIRNLCNAHKIPYKHRRSGPCQEDEEDLHDCRHLRELKKKLAKLFSTT